MNYLNEPSFYSGILFGVMLLIMIAILIVEDDYNKWL